VHAPRFAFLFLTSALAASPVFAGGPKYIAGTAYFNPAVVGQPVHWSGGAVNYYVDQGPLNVQISNQQLTRMTAWAMVASGWMLSSQGRTPLF
jgi:hypothetical protein